MANNRPHSLSMQSSSPFSGQLDDEEIHRCLDLNELVESLPKQSILDSINLIWYRSFWCPQTAFPGARSFFHQFRALDSDVIVASLPKTGTTWLKALTFSILRRVEFPPSSSNHHPLTNSNPHHLVPFFEFNIYGHAGELLDLASMPAPRLLATHFPHDSLPESIHRSACRIVYISRNPLDAEVSAWHFTEQVWPDIRVDRQRSREKYFDYYCKGIQAFGPFWDHILGYRKASLAMPDKVLILKYEDLKEDIVGNIKRIAEFLGVPFSEEEEKEGVVDEIGKLCSLRNLKELDVNKTGSERAISHIENNTYFRKGEVGDWVNHMSPSMAKNLESIIEEKLSPFGLKFGSK